MTIDDAHRKSQSKFRTFFGIAFLAVAAMLVQGYHPGAEDDAVYLAGIHSDLKPALFPFDAQFFRVQLQASIYDHAMAASVRCLHLPVNVVMFCWQFAALCLVLYACLRLARRLFAVEAARWAGTALVATLFALPVAGTALFVIDPQLHPRTLATGLILLAAECVLVDWPLLAAPLLLLAALLHPLMGAFGISFCFFLWIQKFGNLSAASSPAVLAGFCGTNQIPPTGPAVKQRPLAWLLDKPTPEWHTAMDTRKYIFLSRWAWYEWLGAIAPPLLLLWCRQWAARNGRADLARVASALVWYSAFQFAFAVIVSVVPAFVRILPLQPMRFLHLVYLLGILIAGALLGEFVLRDIQWRWAAALVPLAFIMFTVQRGLSPATAHLELPIVADGARSSNPWLQSFAWIAQNTPNDAYFAIDPNYMAAPGEDYHGFRALAQRSVLADMQKDSAVAMQVPRLAPLWLAQSNALSGLASFQPEDFARLHREFGVTWTVVNASRELGFDCPYHNARVKVCKLP